ncbi:hypothetical protein BJ508DRAFT_375801 [Ascobolus immersus RN42]|uniref:RNase H type-1 domain-containing protein n=1 Tax=Ascobolus immersus RN42 TaxID=1160509 RepID=A0A3N4I8B1_ASCIM|nr:hypothetical protein BJ508DRAFT_375801 [Ascobolus immersus RN42]
MPGLLPSLFLRPNLTETHLPSIVLLACQRYNKDETFTAATNFTNFFENTQPLESRDAVAPTSHHYHAEREDIPHTRPMASQHPTRDAFCISSRLEAGPGARDQHGVPHNPCFVRKSFYDKFVLGRTFPLIGDMDVSYDADSMVPLHPLKPVTFTGRLKNKDFDMSEFGFKFYGAVPIPLCWEGKHPALVNCLVVEDIFPQSQFGKHIDVLVGTDYLKNSPLDFRAVYEKGGLIPILSPNPSLLRLEDTTLTINICGACVGDGTAMPLGGVGIYFGEGSIFNESICYRSAMEEVEEIAKRVASPFEIDYTIRQNCHRAEFLACILGIYRAIRIRQIHGIFWKSLNIYTDSVNAINVMTKGHALSSPVNWNGTPKHGNKDLIIVLARIHCLAGGENAVRWHYIPRSYNRVAEQVARIGCYKKEHAPFALEDILVKTKREDYASVLNPEEMKLEPTVAQQSALIGAPVGTRTPADLEQEGEAFKQYPRYKHRRTLKVVNANCCFMQPPGGCTFVSSEELEPAVVKKEPGQNLENMTEIKL